MPRPTPIHHRDRHHRARRRGAVALLWIIVSILVGRPDVARAGPAAPDRTAAVADPEDADDEAAVHRDSPQAAFVEFIALGDTGQFEEAAKYLDLPRSEVDRAQELARRLHAVISRLPAIAPELLSAKATGDLADGLPRAVERIGEIGQGEDAVPVLLQRRARGEPRWVFSRKTVANVDAWYGTLRDRWLIDSLPEPLLRTGWAGLAYWQWLALPLVLAIAWLLARLLARVTGRMVRRLVMRGRADADEVMLRRFAGPFTMAWTLIMCRATLPLLSLLPRADETVRELLGAGLVLLVFWAALRAVDVIADLLARSAWADARAGTAALLPLGARIVKVVVGALAIVAVFAKLDYPIASLLAGLGVGGLAVALAAQKSFENLIGTFALGADGPFREGDFVRVDGFVGTVEAIGLRSTRFRTPERTLVTIPNGKLSEMRLESLAARDRMRLHCTVGVEYGTTEAQMRTLLEAMRTQLAEHPKIWPEGIIVRLAGLGDSALEIEVIALFTTPSWDEFVGIREEVLLGFLRAVEAAGTSMAFPTRTLHLVQPAGQPGATPG